MNMSKGIILCEGISDQILLGAYLSKVKEMTFIKQFAQNPFPNERVNWYSNSSEYYLGIWNVGGCDFTSAVQKIFTLEKTIDHIINTIVVVTDHDDEAAEQKRPEELYRIISGNTVNPHGVTWAVSDNNKWHGVDIEGSFCQRFTIRYCYLLVPFDSQGALETFMLKALSEKSEINKNAILQVKEFIKNFQSEEYLRRRRERIKAELGVTVSVINPERMFDTMIEMINSVDWSLFDLTEKQFGILKEI